MNPLALHSPVAQRSPRPASGVERLAAEIKDRWGQGASPDAQEALNQHPELLAEKSVVLDLAYEEYCQRLEAGEKVDPDLFCERFPAHRTSLRRLLQAHRFLDENSHFLVALRTPAWPEPGTTFLGFALQRELGRGAFARVYLATQPALGERQVALKVAQRGKQEAKTLARIAHRALAK